VVIPLSDVSTDSFVLVDNPGVSRRADGSKELGDEESILTGLTFTMVETEDGGIHCGTPGDDPVSMSFNHFGGFDCSESDGESTKFFNVVSI
jgi:hypothetical protein